MASRVKVAVRVRPMNEREKRADAHDCVFTEDNKCTIKDYSGGNQHHQFCFNKVYKASGDLQQEQKAIYEDLGREVLTQAVAGYNVTVLAYGQTGSGKSLTMVGKPAMSGEDHRGLIPRIAEELFDGKTTMTRGEGMLMAKVHLTMIEIYNEQVKDLLAPPRAEGEKAPSLKVRENPATGPYVEGLSKHEVSSYEQVAERMEARSIAATNMNSGSSRAHTICTLEYRRTNITADAETEQLSVINLVDLAGSERTGEAGTNENAARMKESVNINKSLTALGQCIRALSVGNNVKGKHVSYRDSTLTWLLKNSLGGNAKTIMIATLSPGSSEYHETLSTLRYADRMQKVQTAAVVNKKSVASTEPEFPEEEETSGSPRGLLGVDYTIGEDVSDSDSDCSDGGMGVNLAALDRDNGMAGGGGKTPLAGGVVNLAQLRGRGRGAGGGGSSAAAAAYGNPRAAAAKPAPGARGPAARAAAARVGGARAAGAPARRAAGPSGVSARENVIGRAAVAPVGSGRPAGARRDLGGSISKDDLFTTLKKPLKYYF